jgi:hypothetical protein
VTDNPFAVLTAVVAPAILTNACSVLALNTSNRVARVVDRSRVVAGELASTPKGTVPHDNRLAQIARLQRRAHLLVQALRFIYAALGGFAASALISIVGAIVAYYEVSAFLKVAAAVVALCAGFGAAAGLVSGCVLIVAETRLALRSVDEAVEDAMATRPI